MRAVLAVALLLVTAPVAAQVSTRNIPSAALTERFAREQGSGRENNNFFARDNSIWAARDFEVNLSRAGAWGECVATAAPADSRAYLLSQRTTALLRWSFARCQRKVGQFDGANVVNVRRAALLDALRSPAS